MAKSCNCPIGFNIFIGIFLIGLALVSWLNILEIIIPVWLSVIILILGLLVIILNSLNRSYINAENMTVEQTNKIHANEGY